MNAIPDADLLQAYLDGRLADAEVLALEERLRRQPELVDALVILAREEAILTEWAHSARVAEGAAGTWLPSSFLRPKVAAYLVAAAAVVLLAALGIILKQSGKDAESAFLAAVEEVQGDVFLVTPIGLSVPAQPGQKLFADQELRTRGQGSFAVVKYEDKTRLELSPDTLIRLLDDATPKLKNKRGKKVFLNEGVLAADVVAQPEGSPLVLTTPHAVMEVRESMFSSATAEDATRIELDGGQIRFTRKSDGKSIEVPTGYYAVAAAATEALIPHRLPARVKKPRALLKEFAAPVVSLAYSPEARIMAIGCRDGSLRLCDLQTGAEHAVLGRHRKISPAAFSRSGNLLAAVVDERTVKLWDMATLKEQKRFSNRKLKFVSVAFSPDGTTLATACSDKSVRLWDAVTGLEKGNLHGDNDDVLALAFSPDGNTLAAGNGSGQVILWDVPTRQKRLGLVGHSGPVRSLAFSPSGQVLVSGSDDGTVRLWDEKAAHPRGTLRGHVRRVVSVAVSPDGLRLASAGDDNTVRLWDLASGKELAIFKARKQRISCVAFSPDGKTLATGGSDKTVRLWDVSGKELPAEGGDADE